MLIETSSVRELAIRIPAESGNRNNEGIVQLRSFAQLPRDLVPVHAGHGNVQKDDVRKKRSDDLQGGGAIVDDAYFMTAQAEQFGQAVRCIHVVVDDENPAPDRVNNRR
jgi:hypothetical protein